MPQRTIVYSPIGRVISQARERRPPGDWSSAEAVIELEQRYQPLAVREIRSSHLPERGVP